LVGGRRVGNFWHLLLADEAWEKDVPWAYICFSPIYKPEEFT